MSFPGVVLEVELEALINEVLETVPKMDSKPSSCCYDDSMVDFYSSTREIEFPSYRFFDDEERAQSFDNFVNMLDLNEPADTVYAPSCQQAVNDAEQAYVPPMEIEETASEAQFEDALFLLEEAAGFMVLPEDPNTDQVLAEVNLSEGGFNEEWGNENLDFDIISQSEIESMNTNMQELDEIIESLYNEGNSENPD